MPLVPSPVTDNSGNTVGYATLLVGYDDDINAFKIISSWGTAWGNDGFVWIDEVFEEAAQEVYWSFP